jgi:hypothetical protein
MILKNDFFGSTNYLRALIIFFETAFSYSLKIFY